MGDASRGSPVGSGALPLPLPRFKAALRGAGSSYLAAVPGRAGRGAVQPRRWAVTPAVSLLDPALLGLGEEDLGGEGKGGTCGQAGSGARDPWVSRDPRLPALTFRS